ncbi:response regulator receiver modulated CheB methylesterase [Mariprofundus aestuarium]|uniref:Protein-glutamate methylesterase/protein-glutamine glutaminase n=1 Tax=Mariprofundus aestuarium TaxID=1921086 RepID=A0A2K8L0W4_MARES|nr:chemotaxis response regulator protein-glutamate methylesterase [Mariprofundus aestuarium]ATX78554.1 response regulator receiver modulated CheB methylesterase [Mariprofundus aestuarium]
MTDKIRVLVVDDSVVIRRMVSDVLASDPAIEVIGVAANGSIALDKIAQLKPDLITLDIEMPVMDGLQTLKELRKLYPRLKVIMFSTLTERGARASLDALSLGANDYVTKPANVGSVAAAQQCLRDELVPKIKCFFHRAPVQLPKAPVVSPAKPVVASPAPRPVTTARQRIDVVAIGISTGGPNALIEMIPTLPKDFPVPIVIVQHMPEMFTKLLADRLDQKSAIQVREAAAGDKLQPGLALVAPGGFHMALVRKGASVEVALNKDAPENSCRPAVDVLFRSVVDIYGANTLAVIMTGMGQDGMLGCHKVKEAAGQIIAQDKESSVVWGMPGAVAQAGLAEELIPLNRIGAEIVRRVQTARIGRV